MNQSLEFYPTVLTLPMYNSFVTLCNFACGAIILDEKAMYTGSELLIQMGLCCVCLVGIYILIAKVNLLCCFKSTTNDDGMRAEELSFEMKTSD